MPVCSLVSAVEELTTEGKVVAAAAVVVVAAVVVEAAVVEIKIPQFLQAVLIQIIIKADWICLRRSLQHITRN